MIRLFVWSCFGFVFLSFCLKNKKIFYYCMCEVLLSFMLRVWGVVEFYICMYGVLWSFMLRVWRATEFHVAWVGCGGISYCMCVGWCRVSYCSVWGYCGVSKCGISSSFKFFVFFFRGCKSWQKKNLNTFFPLLYT